MISKSDLKVGDLVYYKKQKYEVGVINGDNTIRLKTKDTTHQYYSNGTIGCFNRNAVIKVGEMISVAQLQSLDFEFNENLYAWDYKDIDIYKDENELQVYLKGFQLYGIRDVRDLTKLIELVYGS